MKLMDITTMLALATMVFARGIDPNIVKREASPLPRSLETGDVYRVVDPHYIARYGNLVHFSYFSTQTH